jgi:hypothetical protein
MKLTYKSTWQTLFVSLVLGFLWAQPSLAEPYLAYKNQMKCSGCHVNPLGGGLRNDFGNIYGQSVLPSTVISGFNPSELGKLNDFIQIGGDLRANAEVSRDEADKPAQGFRVDSAQLYISVRPKDSPLSLYIDQQIGPGAAVNRELFLMYKLSDSYYLKAGKMFSPYGIRLEDDTALVRQVTGFNFDSSDQGIELSAEFNRALINFFVTNGTTALNNNDEKLQYGMRGEYFIGSGRVGATLVNNGSGENKTNLYNLYGAYTVGNWTFLSEVDWLQKTNNGTDVSQLVSLIEANYQWRQGLNLKVSAEYFDPNRNIMEDHETRLSFIAEFTPVSNLQLRMGIRSADSIPQLKERNTDKLFVQAHVYF